METMILADFQICISVPLIVLKEVKKYLQYRESRITDKSKKKIDIVSLKSRTIKKSSTKKEVGLMKVHVKFARTIDIARVRG